jgi:hypothetical protein
MLCVLRMRHLRNTYRVIRFKILRDTYNKTYDIRMLGNLIRSIGFVFIHKVSTVIAICNTNDAMRITYVDLRNTYSVIRIKMLCDTYNKTYDIRMLVNVIRSRDFVLSTVCRYWAPPWRNSQKIGKNHHTYFIRIIKTGIRNTYNGYEEKTVEPRDKREEWYTYFRIRITYKIRKDTYNKYVTIRIINTYEIR